MYMLGENRKYTKWPQTELKHFTVKKYSIYPLGPNFGLFRSTISHFWDACTRSAKIWNAPNDPKTEHFSVKSTPHTLNTPEVQILARFALNTSRFRGPTCTRSSKNGNAPNENKLNLTLYSQKYIHLILAPEAQILVYG